MAERAAGGAGAPLVRVLEVERFERPFRLRLPFRFGVITVTHGRQAVIRLRLRLPDGREAQGYSAEALAAKWFDKNPALSDEDNREQLRRALEIAAEDYIAAGPATAFDLFANGYGARNAAGAAEQLDPLVIGFGPALLDRAILDALCRAYDLSFFTAMRANLPGMRPHPAVPDLAGFDFDAFLAALEPRPAIHARHTVGLLDPVTAADQPAGTRVEDGLPETLEEVVRAYGHRYFKLKVGGDLAADLDRLRRIAAVLDRIPDAYHVTLDGNEQYDSAEAALELWQAIVNEPGLARLSRSVLFVEQPVSRKVALSRTIAPLAACCSVIIDESDATLDAFVAARRLGYQGVSSKSCKGLYKSIVNLARCTVWNAGGGKFFMSAEDLTTQAGHAVQQDLALVALLGLEHVERNGHHFIDGFAGWSDEEAEAFLAAHPDLYHRQNSRVRLRMAGGRLCLGSLMCRGFATEVVPSVAAAETMPRSSWRGAAAPVGSTTRQI
jgi:hypothetical protein